MFKKELFDEPEGKGSGDPLVDRLNLYNLRGVNSLNLQVVEISIPPELRSGIISKFFYFLSCRQNDKSTQLQTAARDGEVSVTAAASRKSYSAQEGLA